MEQFPWALGLKSLDPCLTVCKQGPSPTAIEEDGGNRRLVVVQFELDCKADGIALPDPV